MCGINLIYDIQGALPANCPAGPEPLQRMQNAIAHRGPDHQGTEQVHWLGGQLWLGNTRLRVLDTRSVADQPWHYPSTEPYSYLTYNGELYNYTELRNELLQIGYPFSSGSDTEVVLYALDAWGTEALTRFQGMFALVYINKKRGDMLLARDRHGMKPLFWSQTKNYVVASSEIKGITASKIVRPALNKLQITQYLQHKYAQPPQTFFENIFELEPGHYRLIKQEVGGPISFIKPFQPPSLTGFSVNSLEELLVDSLYRHVQSHRPLGLFLSGGTDSTLILALMRKHLANHMPICYTAGNAPEESAWGTQDYGWAAKVAQQYNARHESVIFSGEEVLTRFTEIAQSQDQPIADSAYWLTYLLSEKAATTTPVVLTGAGADEYFGGYYRLTAFQYYLKNRKLLGKLMPIANAGGALLPTSLAWPGRAKAQQLQKFLNRLHPQPHTTWQNFTGLATEPTTAEQPHLAPNFSLYQAYRNDIEQYLTNDVLAVSDRASMQHGVEIRMPYLDYELLGWLSQFSTEELLSKGRKWMLNTLLTNQPGGKAVANRRKEGFGLPFGLWVKQGKTQKLWHWLEEPENQLHQYLPSSSIKNLLTKHQTGKADYSQELLAVAGLTEWLGNQLEIMN